MENEQRHILKRQIDFLLRRKTILIFFLIIGFAVGLGSYIKKPKIYECTALLKYQRQRINPNTISPDDPRTRPEDVIDTVSQEIMSRSSLESIIKEFNLYPELRSALPMEDVVSIMREFHIRTNSLQDGDVFRVSFEGKDQEKVLKVTNALAAKFIEENLKFRQETATETSSYIRDELRMAKEALDKKEITMRDYKLQYYNEMPEQLTINSNRLSAVQEQYQNNQASSLELERTKLLVQEQIAQRQSLLAQLAAGASLAAASGETDELPPAQKIKMRILELSSRYTDKHPEIVRLKKQLKALENQPTLEGENKNNTDTGVSATVANDPQIQELRQQLESLEFNIDRLEQERQVLGNQIKQYESWIGSAPVREAEWSALTRDYEQLNQHYQKLVTQNIQAESAQTLENQLRGSQFKIVDLAHFPEKPIKPDFKKIMVFTIALWVGIGGIIAVGLELLNAAFYDPVKIESTLEVPVLCSIPVLPTKKEKRRNRLKNFAIATSLTAMGAVLLVATAYLWKKGMIAL